MVGWHHQLNGCEFEQAPGDGDGQESLACCSPWGRRESDMTEQLNNNPDHVRTDFGGWWGAKCRSRDELCWRRGYCNHPGERWPRTRR